MWTVDCGLESCVFSAFGLFAQFRVSLFREIPVVFFFLLLFCFFVVVLFLLSTRAVEDDGRVIAHCCVKGSKLKCVEVDL